jgi:membrane protein DedA with SNARE-associated domain
MTTLVTQLGPLGVFLLMVPESACIPVPSEMTLLCAGFAVREGWMPFWAAVVAATAGNIAGSLIAYWIGRTIAVRGRSVGGRAFGRCDRLFARYGSRAVFVARLMPLARSFVSLPAGHARIALGPFVVMTTIGCAIWAVAFALLGLLAGTGWTKLSGTMGHVLFAVTALAIAAVFAARRRG